MFNHAQHAASAFGWRARGLGKGNGGIVAWRLKRRQKDAKPAQVRVPLFAAQ